MNKVKAWRKQRNITQEQAAILLGVSWRQYQRIEAGHCGISGSIERLIEMIGERA
jgi:transcriptional regulator with XRE-family HTH domain